MSDIVIPGISNNSSINTSKMVDELMEVERVPVQRMEQEVESFQAQGAAWRALGRQMSQLRDNARTLFSFQSPFRDRTAASSSESIVSASADRQAEEGTIDLEVLQVAKRDRLSSAPLEKGYEVPAGRYGFKIGETERSFRFSGGSLRNFADQVNSRLGEVVRATVVPATRDSEVIVFEGQREGADNALVFQEASRDLAQEIGVLSRPTVPSYRALTGEPVVMEPGDTQELPMAQQYSVKENMVLRYQVKVEQLPTEKFEPPPPPTGPEQPETGSLTYGGITIQNENIPLSLPPYVPPQPPEETEDANVVSIITQGRIRELPPIPVSEQYRTVEIPASQLPSTVDGFSFENRNSARRISIQNIEIVDPNARGDSVPLNPIEVAQDARLKYSGVEVVRESNTIDDLVPGVTLNLRRASDEPVTVEVAPDRDQAKDAVIQVVGLYNQLIRDINIYTRTEESIIEEIEYFAEDERETARERLGIFQGDTTVSRIRERLQRIMMDPYNTDAGSQLRLLAQAGISTNASGIATGGFNAGRLRGYLEIDEEQLDRALESNFEAVGQLFGRDSDGDMVMDEGVAVALDQYLAPYVRVGGIVSTRTGTIEDRVSQTEDRIERYNERLEDYEQDLRNDFARMEGAMQSLEDSAGALDRLGGNNQNQ